MRAACSGVEMPKPTAHGSCGAASRMSVTMPPMSEVISLRTPVTPSELTI